MAHIAVHLNAKTIMVEKDEINVPIALTAFRDKGSRLWSFEKKKKKKKKKS